MRWLTRGLHAWLGKPIFFESVWLLSWIGSCARRTTWVSASHVAAGFGQHLRVRSGGRSDGNVYNMFGGLGFFRDHEGQLSYEHTRGFGKPRGHYGQCRFPRRRQFHCKVGVWQALGEFRIWQCVGEDSVRATVGCNLHQITAWSNVTGTSEDSDGNVYNAVRSLSYQGATPKQRGQSLYQHTWIDRLDCSGRGCGFAGWVRVTRERTSD